ncbi:MAG: class I SAM-dependent methyltransferase [Chloroflexota bacterium]
MPDSSPAQDTIWQGESLARHYLDGVRGAIPLAREQIDYILRLIAAARPEVQSILDLGCGDGILGHAILDYFAEDQPSAVLADFSETMLEAARQRLSGYERVAIVEVDYADDGWTSIVTEAAGFPFDVIVSGYSIHHQPDDMKRRIYEQIYRMLQPGGIFLNLEHVASPTRWGADLFSELFIDSLYAYNQRIGGIESRESLARAHYERADEEANILSLVTTQCDWLTEIGFTNVDCYFKIFELALFGGTKPTDHASGGN